MNTSTLIAHTTQTTSAASGTLAATSNRAAASGRGSDRAAVALRLRTLLGRLRTAPGPSPSPSEQALSDIGVTQTYHR